MATTPTPAEPTLPEEIEDVQRDIMVAVSRTADLPVTSDALRVQVYVPFDVAAEILHEHVDKVRIRTLDNLAVHDTIVGHILTLLGKGVEKDLGPYEQRIQEIVDRYNNSPNV